MEFLLLQVVQQFLAKLTTMDNFMFAFLFLIGVIFISRMINEKAVKKLEANKKAELIDLFSKNKVYNYLITFIVIAGFFLVLKFELLDKKLSFSIYFTLFVIYLGTTFYISYKKIRKNDFPKSYIKTYLLVSGLRFLGFIVFIIIILSMKNPVAF